MKTKNKILGKAISDLHKFQQSRLTAQETTDNFIEELKNCIAVRQPLWNGRIKTLHLSDYFQRCYELENLIENWLEEKTEQYTKERTFMQTLSGYLKTFDFLAKCGNGKAYTVMSTQDAVEELTKLWKEGVTGWIEEDETIPKVRAKKELSKYSISQLVNELKNRSGVRILIPQSGNKLIIDFGKRIRAVVIDCDVLDE